MDQNVAPPRPTVDQLQHVVFNYPIIDHHAHNLILHAQAETIPLETITTEAQGRALRDTFKSLPHLRAAKQLRQLYECGEDADWADILEQRVEWLRSNPDRLHQQCFTGVHALLIDDGLAGADKVYPFDHHDRFTKAPTKRIVRIEATAERLMRSILRKANEDDLGETKFLPNTWVKFTDEFEREIQDAIADPDVAGFKTVICYRTGLDIEPDYEEAAKAVGHPFERYVKNCIRKRSYRIEKKAVNDYLVLRTLEILSEKRSHSDDLTKPLQFHTGLGDNDINLVEANPAFLQQVIENYPRVPIVLLHAAYPYTREAGYLATVYRHVYLDIGEIFPMVSRDGQRAVLRQAMELAPGSKLLYSSDGRWFPETFFLANLQFREVWLEVLLDMISKGDITPHQGIGMTKDILFNNANVLYDLRNEAVFDETIQEVPRQLTYNPRPDGISPVQAPMGPPPGRTPDPQSRSATFDVPRTRSISPFTPATFPPPPTVAHVYDAQLLTKFQQENVKVKFVYVQWLSCLGEIRARIIPMKGLERMVHEGERIEISQDDTGIVYRDPSTAGTDIPMRVFLEPDLRSLRRTYNGSSLPAATVFSYWRDEAGNPISLCPRNNLEVLINGLQYNYSTTLLVGFELQVTILPKTPPQRDTYAGSKPSEWLQQPYFTEIVIALEEVGIDVQQYYTRDTMGQYTFILAPQPPLLAVDTYVQTHQTISQIADQHNMRATLHPQPFDGASRTSTRAAISLNPPDRDMQFFVGGILSHLPALCAFSMPEDASYDPATPMQWVSWSSQSTSTPLRRVKPGKWDIRSLDGLANMYSALSAFIAAGLLGLASGESQFTQMDVPPYAVDEQMRAQYGVVQLMPRYAAEAMTELRRDGVLAEAMAPGVVAEYMRLREDRVHDDVAPRQEERRDEWRDERDEERIKGRMDERRDKGKEKAVEERVPRLPDLDFRNE